MVALLSTPSPNAPDRCYYESGVRQGKDKAAVKKERTRKRNGCKVQASKETFATLSIILS